MTWAIGNKCLVVDQIIAGGRTKTPGLSTGCERRVGKDALLFLFSY